MDKLEKARNTINATDKKIAALFCERMAAVKEVADYKKEHGLKVYDEEREEELIAKNATYVEDPVVRSYYVNFLRGLMAVSKQYQTRLNEGMKVAYSGVPGAFAHIAAKKIFPDGRYISCVDFPSAYASVEKGESDLCVLPIENSFAGEVGQVTDLLFNGALFVTGVYDLAVSHNLLGVPGAKLSDIKTVVSHPQALSQCEPYIRFHGFAEIKEKNTAVAAKNVALGDDKTVAAIASAETARLYGLEILDHDINEDSGNTTRFAVLSRVENKVSKSDAKFIMLFTARNVAGSLAKAINIIGQHGFNMRVLRSRPIKERSWQYYFYVEAEGDAYSEEAKEMCAELAKQCEKVKIIGSFAKEEILEGKEL